MGRPDELIGPIFFNGKTNSCGVAIRYVGNKKVDVLNKKKIIKMDLF